MRRLFVILGIVGALAACNATPDDALPTLVPIEEQEAASATPDVPTETATDTPEPVFTPTEFIRATLPPTWTPSATPTVTPTSTPTPITPTATSAIVSLPTSTNCDDFRIDFANTVSNFEIGDVPTVSWFPIPDAQVYVINVTRDDGALVMRDASTTDTSVPLGANMFTQGRFYGWNVRPLDAAGIQICNAIGGELIPR